MLRALLLISMMILTRCQGVEEEDLPDPDTSSSSLHYNFIHDYGLADHHSPYAGHKHQHGHHITDIGG